MLESSAANSFNVLKKNQEELRQLVRTKFKEAVSVGDVKSVERFVCSNNEIFIIMMNECRFFKMYPSLGLQEEGMEGFCSYLQDQVVATVNTIITSGWWVAR